MSQSLISEVDLAPTFLALAGAKAAPSMQGRSIEATLGDPDAQVRNVVFAEHNWHDFDDHHLHPLAARTRLAKVNVLASVRTVL